MKLTYKQKKELWWLIISVNYNFERIAIADFELSGDTIRLWIEDKDDFKNSLEECLMLSMATKEFKKVIVAQKLHTYEGIAVRPDSTTEPAKVVINQPLHWYLEDASPIEQQQTRNAFLKAILTTLIETDLCQDF